MGRLRDGFETPLFRGISEEVIDLFGNEDGVLYRFDEAGSEPTRDPLWDEPSFKAKFKPFKMPYLIQDFINPMEVSEYGQEALFQANIFLTREHLLKAGVPVDSSGDFVRPGDIIGTFLKGMRMYWYITQTDRTGFINDSDSWTMYNLACKRTEKFVPERDLGDNKS